MRLVQQTRQAGQTNRNLGSTDRLEKSEPQPTCTGDPLGLPADRAGGLSGRINNELYHHPVGCQRIRTVRLLVRIIHSGILTRSASEDMKTHSLAGASGSYDDTLLPISPEIEYSGLA